MVAEEEEERRGKGGSSFKVQSSHHSKEVWKGGRGGENLPSLHSYEEQILLRRGKSDVKERERTEKGLEGLSHEEKFFPITLNDSSANSQLFPRKKMKRTHARKSTDLCLYVSISPPRVVTITRGKYGIGKSRKLPCSGCTRTCSHLWRSVTASRFLTAAAFAADDDRLPMRSRRRRRRRQSCCPKSPPSLYVTLFLPLLTNASLLGRREGIATFSSSKPALIFSFL